MLKKFSKKVSNEDCTLVARKHQIDLFSALLLTLHVSKGYWIFLLRLNMLRVNLTESVCDECSGFSVLLFAFLEFLHLKQVRCTWIICNSLSRMIDSILLKLTNKQTLRQTDWHVHVWSWKHMQPLFQKNILCFLTLQHCSLKAIVIVYFVSFSLHENALRMTLEAFSCFFQIENTHLSTHSVFCFWI